jgi:iron complex outermembrane receptor protein
LYKTIAFASTSLFALASATLASAETSKASDNQVAEVVITATKQTTNLQTTPIAITAVTSEKLAERSITDAADLGSIVPNATFREAQGAFGKGVTAFIRGIGQADTNLASEPGVAFYIDDVYYPLVFGSMFDLLDLDHVEVLRGPQGTLFGRNALAGAVNLVSKQPDPTHASGYAEVTTGTYDRLELRAGINIPLADNLAFRVSATSKKRTGYQARLDFRCDMVRRGTPELAGNFGYSEGLLVNTANFTAKNCVIGHLGGEDVHAARGSFLWEPTSKLRVTLIGDWTQDNSENVADQLIAVNATTAAGNSNLRAITASYSVPGQTPFAYDSRFVTGNPFTTYNTYGDPIQAGTVIPGSSFYNGSNLRGGFRYPANSPTLNWGFSAKAVLNLATDIDLTAVGGYRKYDTVFSFDVDGSPIALENTRNNTGEDHWSGEIRLAGKRSWIDWVGGLFYYRGHGYVHTTLVSPYNNLQRYQNHDYEPESKAAYANVVIRPLDKVSIHLGGRYSDDKKPVAYSNLQDANPAGNIIFNVTPADSRFDWKAGIDYQLMDRTMVYFSAATGFRLPSFNSRPLQPDQVTQIPGDDIQTYELGVKTDLFDRRLRVNATGFYTDYKTRPAGVSGQEYLIGSNGQPVPGTQITQPLPTGGPNATTCRTLTPQEIAAGTQGFQCIGRTYYVNTPGTVKGVELELDARPIDHLSITGEIGYSKFDSPDLNAPTRVNHRLTGIPDWNASAGIQYEIDAPMLNGTIVPRLDWLYQGSIVYSAVSTTYNQPGYSVFNARVSYHNSAYDTTFSVGATNLFNTFYYRNFFIYQELGYPNVNAQPGPPREIFVSLRKNF